MGAEASLEELVLVRRNVARAQDMNGRDAPSGRAFENDAHERTSKPLEGSSRELGEFRMPAFAEIHMQLEAALRSRQAKRGSEQALEPGSRFSVEPALAYCGDRADIRHDIVAARFGHERYVVAGLEIAKVAAKIEDPPRPGLRGFPHIGIRGHDIRGRDLADTVGSAKVPDSVDDDQVGRHRSLAH
jgi:hypothetical protein